MVLRDPCFRHDQNHQFRVLAPRRSFQESGGFANRFMIPLNTHGNRPAAELFDEDGVDSLVPVHGYAIGSGQVRQGCPIRRII